MNYESIIKEVKDLMDSSLREFIYELYDDVTVEHMRCLILDRFRKEFILTRRVEGGFLDIQLLREESPKIVATMDVEFLYPFRHRERAISVI